MNKYNPNIHHRKSIRLKGYDYSQEGLYFITLCTQNRECLFGNITNGNMILNDAGIMVEKCWHEIPHHFPNTKLHEMVVMPNHFHGIIEITPAVGTTVSPETVGANDYSPNYSSNNIRANDYSPLRSPSKTIGSIVRGFKIGVTKWFRENKQNQFPIGKPVWQRNYWDRIIRNNDEYQHIMQYIINNPQQWENDKLNGGSGNIVLEPQYRYESWTK